MARTVTSPSRGGGRSSLGEGSRKTKNTARKSTGGKAPRHSGGRSLVSVILSSMSTPIQ